MKSEISDKVKMHACPDGAQVALGGWVISRCVVALVHEMIKQKKRNLTVTQGVGAMDEGFTIGFARWMSMGGTWGRSFP